MLSQLIFPAAYCVKGKNDSHEFNAGDFSVLLGVHNNSQLQEKGRIHSCVNSINIHSDWNTDVENYEVDVAVLELANEIQFTNYIQPICSDDEWLKSHFKKFLS